MTVKMCHSHCMGNLYKPSKDNFHLQNPLLVLLGEAERVGV